MSKEIYTKRSLFFYFLFSFFSLLQDTKNNTQKQHKNNTKTVSNRWQVFLLLFPFSSFLSLLAPPSLFPSFLLFYHFYPFYCLFFKDFCCLSPMLGFSRWDILRCKKTLKIAYALFNVFQKQLSLTDLIIPDGRKPHMHNIRIILRQYYHTLSLIHSMYSNSTYSV